MAKKTPEGEVKDEIKRRLKAYVKKFGRRITWKMPTPGAMGNVYGEPDFRIMAFGVLLLVEAKRPGEVPTDSQKDTMIDYNDAGAVCIYIDGTNYDDLDKVLSAIVAHADTLSSVYASVYAATKDAKHVTSERMAPRIHTASRTPVPVTRNR